MFSINRPPITFVCHCIDYMTSYDSNQNTPIIKYYIDYIENNHIKYRTQSYIKHSLSKNTIIHNITTTLTMLPYEQNLVKQNALI